LPSAGSKRKNDIVYVNGVIGVVYQVKPMDKAYLLEYPQVFGLIEK
jgi:hypothetical protein